LLPALAFGGEAAKTGIVKGTISVGKKSVSDVVVDVVVSVEGVPQIQNSKVKTTKAVMDQKDMKFVPRVLAVVAGTTVDFPNNDNTWHNVFSTSEPKEFDLGLYPPGKSRSVTFDTPGVVKILCNVHPAMEAYVVVKNHPSFVMADRRGNYQIKAIPLGKYRLEVWHPEFSKREIPFEIVREGEVLAIDADLKKQR
jgi:plastocyanin